MSQPLLSVETINAGYGLVSVLHDVSISVMPGEIVCLIGSNGAGKTTLLRTISGVLTPASGSVRLDGADLTGAGTKAIVRAGIVHVPEGRRLFAGLSVRENLLMGAYLRGAGTPEVRRDLDRVLATFPRLAERASQDASTLSGGEQQMCAIGRGLMAAPRLLMIDELSLGLAPKVVDELVETLAAINKSGTAILVVEQDVATALALAQRGFVLDTGRIVASDSTRALAESPEIQKAYLGAELELAG
ncbi:MAG: ABC transporter ATP-binding protein [Hyphomicrobiales bacterium]|nr:MAG: ABC transporter ATP-binding protein [Hyphomicrobiales bacterium]